MSEKFITVKDLINLLLEHDMSWEVQLKDKEGNRLREVSIVAVKPEGLVSLFG